VTHETEINMRGHGERAQQKKQNDMEEKKKEKSFFFLLCLEGRWATIV